MQQEAHSDMKSKQILTARSGPDDPNGGAMKRKRGRGAFRTDLLQLLILAQTTVVEG